MKVAITDNTFGSFDIEETILRPIGCEVVGGQCKTSATLIALVSDADASIAAMALAGKTLPNVVNVVGS